MKARHLVTLVLFSPAALLAQVVAPPAAKPAQEEAVVLSPFVVNTSADSDGYRATSTLAGIFAVNSSTSASFAMTRSRTCV